MFLIKIFIICFCMFKSPVFANTYTEPETEISQTFLKSVETYVNSLKTISGNFYQESSNGAKDSGKFYISKPGKIRLEYNSPILLVADGDSIVYQDKSLDQISYLPLKSNPASVVLNNNITITGKNPTAKVKKVEYIDNIIEITLSTVAEKKSGVITLMFEKTPLSLIGWKVKDINGITTTVKLTNIKPLNNIDLSLFKITRKKPIGQKKSRSKYY